MHTIQMKLDLTVILHLRNLQILIHLLHVPLDVVVGRPHAKLPVDYEDLVLASKEEVQAVVVQRGEGDAVGFLAADDLVAALEHLTADDVVYGVEQQVEVVAQVEGF
jgi:hypothetical protein